MNNTAAHKYLPTLENYLQTPRGEPGWLCTFYSHDEHGEISVPIQEHVLNDTRVKLNDFLPEGLTPTWSIKLEGKLTVTSTALYELGLTVAGSSFPVCQCLCIIKIQTIRTSKTLG